MSETNTITAVYQTQADAEFGVQQLQRAAFDLHNLSVIGKPSLTEAQILGFSRDHINYWGRKASFLEGVWGHFGHAAFFAIPGIGSVLISGPMTASLVDTLEQFSTRGLSPLGIALIHAGIPHASIPHYESEVKRDRLLVIACGTAGEVLQARNILHATGPTEIIVHFDSEELQAA
jgi:hypothetical protein